MFGTPFALLLDPHIYDIYFQKPRNSRWDQPEGFQNKTFGFSLSFNAGNTLKTFPLIQKKNHDFQDGKSSGFEMLVLDAGNEYDRR